MVSQMPLSRLSIASCAIEAARLNLQSPSGAGHVRAHSPPPTPEHVIVVRPTSESNARDVFLTFQTEQQKVPDMLCMLSYHIAKYTSGE